MSSICSSCYNHLMNIVFPELQNPIISKAISEYNSEHTDGGITPIPATSLEEACRKTASGEADALIAGIDYTTRDVVLACKDFLGMPEGVKTFSSCFVLKNDSAKSDSLKTLILADAGVTKVPTENQLYDIVLETYDTAKKILMNTPKIAMLSFSTMGSAKDESIDKIKSVITRIRSEHPEIEIDGEMQLDCAINPEIAAKKAPGSVVAGHANVLIVPDLNSGNILYKSLEQFGGYTAAGPILQGFKKPASDLSRGSSVEDVKLVIETIVKLAS